MPKVGIYAGTFDPVHDGHIAFALQAVSSADLDKVFFLVEPRPRRKQGVKALEHRIAMVKLATENHENLGVITLNQARFSVNETMPVLANRFEGAQLHLLVGSDVLMHLSSWPHLSDITGSVCFIIGIRGENHPSIKEHIAMIEKTKGIQLNYQLFNAREQAISSSSIRAAIRRGEEPHGIPQAIKHYIAKYSLYSSVTGS